MVDMDDGQATLVLRRCDEWCVDYLLFLQVHLGANRCTAAQSMPVAGTLGRLVAARKGGA